MCGIAGELNWGGSVDPVAMEKVISAMVHRGPDAGSIKQCGKVVLGHRRLSVIDTRAVSNQPMFDRDGLACIVFNGEIYNHGQLRQELVARGAEFLTNSDTEVILQAYLHWDVECLAKFVGMFAFAIWDVRKQRLFIARDRMGEKPLYFFENEYGVVFASELKALMQHPYCPQAVDPRAISQFLSLNYVLTDCCIIQGVKKLAPAHYILADHSKPIVIKEYWALNEFFNHKQEWSSYKLAQDRLNELISQSVSGQIVADVPLGAFLSGGVDSSTIVYGMAKLAGSNRTKTYSIGFNEHSYNELPEAQSMADYLGVGLDSKVIAPHICDNLPAITSAYDEPFADSSMIPTYFLCQFARQNVTVSLSGDGGDELFLGYETYMADKLHNVFSGVPNFIIQAMRGIVNAHLPVTFHKVSFDYKLRQFLAGLALPFERAHYHWRTIFSDAEKRAFLNDPSIMEYDPAESFLQKFSEVSNCHFLDQASYVDMKTWLVDDILIKLDQAAMAHSLETRVPFLDHRIVEFAAGLPVSWKLNRGNKKAILKSSQEGNLPHDLLYRKKKGFNAPVSHWLSKDLAALGKSATLDTPLTEWLNGAVIESLWRDHENKVSDNGLKLYGLVCLGLWLQKHYEHINRKST
ncbi:asparagine synthase (glutamine-hydrolyzing) [Methylomonas sp. SURF-2]|uniref:asparagine synthase (glutamine-hydrolyzing) n=1 Tax=Methylomonas subterranea TaxID=2952225 RepID=A0ABT1TCT1_9GAMM|nr:asparagine synthase (glutamine-hydrolyzing) [Methylomonas sp. SURF-2]MCQ8103104.1 asparagine synthase (glutamine-hydrolyzing) [Methylomonas sp. SURF-2]